MAGKNFIIKVNSIDKVEQLLQEVYNQACQELVEIQNEINKLAAANLKDATIEERTKYAKAMKDFTETKMKALQMKFDMAKFMGDIIKHNGDVKQTMEDPETTKMTSFNIKAWKSVADETIEPEAQIYDLKK